VHTLISQFALPPCVLFAKDDDIAELQRTGAVLARKYLEEAAPEIPATLEQSILGEIGGVPVRGYIDLVDVDERHIELNLPAGLPDCPGFHFAAELPETPDLNWWFVSWC
jgi:hypothetical protein